MIALLNYGSGVPFNRLERLETQLGIPLPAATQWELMEEAAKQIKPRMDEFIRQAAQGEVLHNDDTGMRMLQLAREPSRRAHGYLHQRHRLHPAGAGRSRCTSPAGKHAGENLADVLKQRATGAGAPDSDVRCAVAEHAQAAEARRSCWPTVWRTEDASLWKLRRTFPKNAGMCWRRWATYIATTRRRESAASRRKNG